MGARNQVVASGRLISIQPLRYTPAGIAVFEFKLEHESTQREAGSERQIQCEIACVCLGNEAVRLAALAESSEITVKGFLAAKSKRWKNNLVLHVANWKLAPDAESPVI